MVNPPYTSDLEGRCRDRDRRQGQATWSLGSSPVSPHESLIQDEYNMNTTVIGSIKIHKQPGGLFIEPAFSTFAVFVIDFIPQITVVLHLSKFNFLKKYVRTFHWICKKPQRHSLFFCAKCSSQFLQWAWRGFCGNCFPISTAKREHASKSCHWARLT